MEKSDLAIARSVLDLAVGFVTTVEEAGGGIEDARRAIFKDDALKRQLGLLVMRKLKLEESPCQRLVPHLVPDWAVEVVEDVEPTVTEGSVLSFHGFLEGEETHIDGEAMRRRAAERNQNKGLSDVPALLGKDGKGLETIPAELRGKAYIILAGTLLRGSSGGLCVSCLGWRGGEWWLGFSRRDGGWRGGGRLVSCE